MIPKKEFWENKHEESSTLWLTKTRARKIYKYHGIEFEVKSTGLNILEIGIGPGLVIQDLVPRHNLTAVDISEIALDNVKSIANTYLVSDFENIADNTFDLIICHLVMQHCDKTMVNWIVNNAIRCVKSSGKCSFQFAHLPKECITDNFHLKGITNGTHYFLTPDEIDSIIKKNFGKTICSPIIRKFPNGKHNIIWYFYKFTCEDK